MESAAFIDREKELAFLESKWEEGKAQLVVLWGKRRVGKTELVKRFIQGKPHVYHLGQSTGDKEQLDRFSQALGVFFREPLLGTRGFAAWEESFKYVQQKETHFVLVIDEFPYLIQSNPAIPGLFQTAWDEYWAKSKVYVILLGSSVAMMETEVLGHRAPLFGRRTGQWKVQPMPFTAVSGFRSARSFEDRLMHYGVAGGTPAYWLRFGEKKTFDDNLRDHVLRKGEMLYDEVEFLLDGDLSFVIEKNTVSHAQSLRSFEAAAEVAEEGQECLTRMLPSRMPLQGASLSLPLSPEGGNNWRIPLQC